MESFIFKDPLFAVKLSFFQSVVVAIQLFLTEFQSDTPLAFFILTTSIFKI